MGQIKVGVIILNWNGKKDTDECLDSLKSITYPNYEIILVDNGSTDGSVEYLKKLHPEIEIIENQKNLGFAEGNNVGIIKAIENKADYVLLLNNDTVVSPDFLTTMIDVAESNDKYGIVGPKICYYHDPSKIWSVGGDVNLFTGSIKNKGNMDPQEMYKGIKIVDYISGCSLLIRSELIKKIGLLDKDYFLYFEETDWNMRAHKEGYVSVITCDAKILHKSGASIKKVNNLNYYYFSRNGFLFFKKNGSWYHYITFIPINLIRYGSMFCLNLIVGNYSASKYILNGIVDYINGKCGPYERKST
jgi:GT2 family glycosyltransferase